MGAASVTAGLTAAALLAAVMPRAQAATFDELWAQARARSPGLRAAQLAAEASTIARGRSGRAWWPRVSLEARAYGTDDPAGSFFALLGQRSIEPADLSPATLNGPATRLFGEAALGADWLLYEGGARAGEEQAARAAETQRTHEHEAATVLVYAQLARLYASALAFELAAADVRPLHDTAAEVLASYRLGTPDNPLAYSGRLALEALALRLEVELARHEAAARSARRALATLAGRPAEVVPEPQELVAFVKARLPRAPAAPSARARALASAADAARERPGVERARRLPKAGLYARAPLFAGERGVGLAWTAGAYVRWDALDAPSLDVAAQAALEGEALAARADAEREQDEVESARALAAAEVAEQALPVLAQNGRLLAEQTRVARELFRSGVLNALLLAEAFGRRADAADALLETRLAYVEAAVALALHAAFAVPGGVDGR